MQLNWNKDDREGRFVLKNENDAAAPKVGAAQVRGPQPLGPWVGSGTTAAGALGWVLRSFQALGLVISQHAVCGLLGAAPF